MTKRKNSINQSSWQRGYLLLALALFGLLPTTQAVSPPPGGGYAGDNTAEGINALFELTSGVYNTATGFAALFNDSTGSSNAAIGFGALYSNTTGGQNTAEGSRALFSNTTGVQNTANGCRALLSNTTGSLNTAVGYQALNDNTTGGFNCAVGELALASNTSGPFNDAFGNSALANNTTGQVNNAIGGSALGANTTGSSNTAVGNEALLHNTTASNNTAIGAGALDNNTTGSNNIAVGVDAGENIGVLSNNIDIGNPGVSSDAQTIRIGDDSSVSHITFIAGILNVGVTSGTPVMIGSNGQLGTLVSSRRFKQEIKPMDKSSEAILKMQPVTFHYKQEIDPKGSPQFGLIAEDVAKVNPDLVVRDAKGEIYSVRYEAVNAMLLNEFLKEHRRVEEQERTITQLKATVAQQQNGMEGLAANLKEQASQIQAVTQRLDQTPSLPLQVNNGQ